MATPARLTSDLRNQHKLTSPSQPPLSDSWTMTAPEKRPNSARSSRRSGADSQRSMDSGADLDQPHHHHHRHHHHSHRARPQTAQPRASPSRQLPFGSPLRMTAASSPNQFTPKMPKKVLHQLLETRIQEDPCHQAYANEFKQTLDTSRQRSAITGVLAGRWYPQGRESPETQTFLQRRASGPSSPIPLIQQATIPSLSRVATGCNVSYMFTGAFSSSSEYRSCFSAEALKQRYDDDN